MTTYHVTAWCALPHYTTFEVQADSLEDALAKAKEQAINEHPEPCNGGEYDWDEFQIDPEDDNAPGIYHLEPNARLNSAARELLELVK